MTDERFVVLGLARARAEWFRRLSHWATAGSLPAEFVKCLTVEELEARLDGPGAYSALLVDEAVTGVDRDLLGRARARGLAAIVVVERGGRRPWAELGAHALLDASFEPAALLDALRGNADLVRTEPTVAAADDAPATGRRGTRIAVCGAGGAGSSTVAIALAQGLSRADARSALLADVSLVADQAMYHDVTNGGPGLLGLVEAHRRGQVEWPDLARHVHLAPSGYYLLTGLRRRSAWPALRRRAFEATLATLTHFFRWAVFDADADVEGEAESGSADIEDRNLMARSCLSGADAVAVVVGPGLRGASSALRILHDLRDLGIGVDRTTLVVNRSPGRSALRETRAAVTDVHPDGKALRVIGLPDRPVEKALRAGRPLPGSVVDPLLEAFRHSAARDAPPPEELTPVRPGELGTWTPDVPGVLSG